MKQVLSYYSIISVIATNRWNNIKIFQLSRDNHTLLVLHNYKQLKHTIIIIIIATQ